MNIILVSDGLAKARTINVSRTQLILAVGAVLLAVYALGAWTGSARGPVPSPLAADQLGTTAKPGSGLRYTRQVAVESLNGLAIKLGELQAQLQRLDAFSERLGKSVGVKPQDIRFDQSPGRGGPLENARSFTPNALASEVDKLARSVQERGAKLDVLDRLLRNERVEKNHLIPTTVPVTAGYHSSNFGSRVDPFTGALAFHAGIDFIAVTGSDIYAAAGGVVTTSEMQSEYGNLVEIDHGNGLTSRYAHASKRAVKPGDIVIKGQKIAEVGSTGRSTGAHLHFEVREHGAPINPIKFLKLGS